MVILKRSKQINDTGHLLPKSRDSHYNLFLVLKMYHFKAIGLFINHYHHYCFAQRFHIGIAQQIYALGVREKLEKDFFFKFLRQGILTNSSSDFTLVLPQLQIHSYQLEILYPGFYCQLVFCLKNHSLTLSCILWLKLQFMVWDGLHFSFSRLCWSSYTGVIFSVDFLLLRTYQ